MDVPLNTPIKIEKTFDRDSNDNIRDLLFDIEIKVEKDLETKEDEDWSVFNFKNCGDLLKPVFFKQMTVLEGPQCEICYDYFEDRFAILKHNLTHLRVTISNPALFQCDHCSSYFTHKKLLIRHLVTHNQNRRTKTVSYEIDKMNLVHKINSNECKLESYKTNHDFKANDSNLSSKIKIKPRDGMTNLLNYKPKSSTMLPDCDININKTNISNHKKNHQCMKCKKSFTYTNWHGHMKEVHGEGGYFCGTCNIEFKCQTYLKRHMIKRHIVCHTKAKNKCSRGEKRMDVKCDECDAVLKCLNALTTHKRNVHSKDKHICHICNSVLKCKAYLLAHVQRVHYTDGKKHVCKCGKNFRSNRYLMVHKRNAQH